MTKQEQIDDIDLKLGDASDILASELRTVEKNQIDAIYADYKNEVITGGVDAPTNTIISVISSSSSNYFSINLDFKISGKSCHVKGYFFYNTTSTYSDQPLFEFTDVLYQPFIEFVSQIGAISTGMRHCRLKRVGSEIHTVNAIAPYETYYIDATYEINN
jgi:2',3'-cyclic-nucleotide 2'-phosphodiesterase (5'-nucleotidase family)